MFFLFSLGLVIGQGYYLLNFNANFNKNITITSIDKLKSKKNQEEKPSNIGDSKGLIEAGKYCYIVIPRNDKKLYIWSFLKASYQTGNTFRYIKTNIYNPNSPIERIFFEGGHTLYINGDSLQYNGKNYNIGKYLNVFVDNDHLDLGRFIPLFKYSGNLPECSNNDSNTRNSSPRK